MVSINNVQPSGYNQVLNVKKVDSGDKISIAAPIAAAAPITVFSNNIENIVRDKLPIVPEDYILHKAFDIVPHIPGTPSGNLYNNFENLTTNIGILTEQLKVDPNNQALILAKSALEEQKATIEPIVSSAVTATDYAVKGAFFGAFSFIGGLLAPIVATIIIRPLAGLFGILTGKKIHFKSISIKNVGRASAIGFGIGGAVKGGILGAAFGPAGIAIGVVAGLIIGSFFGWLGGLLGGAILKPFC
jgi:hypothetical protein